MRTIVFADPAILVAEPAFVAAAFQRIADRGGDVNALHFHNPRNDAGWLEAYLVYNCDESGDYQLGVSMTVCMIQRKPGDAYEWHS